MNDDDKTSQLYASFCRSADAGRIMHNYPSNVSHVTSEGSERRDTDC